MENLMNFIEQYWGVTIVGGVTVGGLITFAVVQIKTILKERSKSEAINTLMDTVENLIEAKHAAEVQHAEEKVALLQENQYYKATTAVMFKSVAYLVAASKLPIEEKLALQEEFVNLKNVTFAQLAPVAQAAAVEVKQEVQAVATEKAPVVNSIITEALNTATSLIDKYTQKEGE